VNNNNNIGRYLRAPPIIQITARILETYRKERGGTPLGLLGFVYHLNRKVVYESSIPSSFFKGDFEIVTKKGNKSRRYYI
jgi:hypothetical protein